MSGKLMERLLQEEISVQLKDGSIINASQHRKLALSEKKTTLLFSQEIEN